MKKFPLKPKLIVIVGSTSAGKTSLSVALAEKFGGEIISADSRQVYRGFDLGSGKVTEEEMRGIPHHLLDVADPKKIYTAAHYKKDVKKALAEIYGRNKIPLLVGGTGFYIDAVVKDLTVPRVKPDKKLRALLEKESAARLFARLKKADRERAKTIDPKNKRRLIRALEIVRKLGQVPKIKTASPFEVLSLGIKRENEELKKRIRRRILDRMDQGMLEEVKNLRQNGVSWKRLYDLGLEYRYLSLHLRGRLTAEQMLDELERATWRFAKRQWTWFKRDKKIHWIKTTKEAEKLVKHFLQ